ncbi:hypothetical protein [Flavobacterium sp.]|uniref:hypothetical protein n=1 Tax=Flavobacterium sp. TaxID=239 RepID=UPI003D6A58E5
MEKENELIINIVGAELDESKQIEILDSKLAVYDSTWISANQCIFTVPEGIYAVRLNLITGNQYERIAVVDMKKPAEISFDLSPVFPEIKDVKTGAVKEFSTPEDKILFEIFGESGIMEIEADQRAKSYPTARLWTLWDQQWTAILLPNISFDEIGRAGKTFRISTYGGLQIMELDYPEGPSQYVSLPPYQDVNCHIRLFYNPVRECKLYDVSLKMSNSKAQALLSLMTSGDMIRARSLWALNDAETLLLEKIQDPTAAAIGGYYLLKTDELARLHDWANNLANWFSWLPDGCIIHAWQMIMENNTEKNDHNYQDRIKNRLLESLERGMPIYTEGIRLLYEGLVMCSFQFEEKDEDIETALKNVRGFIANSDMTKETLTYIGQHPNLPIDESIKLTEPSEEDIFRLNR